MYKFKEMKTPTWQPISSMSSASTIDESSISNATVITTKQQQPPSWEVLLLVSRLLDPKTLAIASCVCKPWSICMAQDHLWRPIYLFLFPSISHLRHFHPTLSYQRLYALARIAGPFISCPISPFTISSSLNASLLARTGRRVLSLGKSGADLLNSDQCASGVWQFDMQVRESDSGGCLEEEVKEGLKVVLKDWKAAFFMMEGKGKG